MKIFILLILFFGASAYGGQDGNGGDVVTCRSGSPFSIKVLDEYEAESRRGWSPISTESGSYVSIARQYIEQSILSRLPMLSANILSKVEAFESLAHGMRNVTLTDIPDSLHTVLPDGCVVEQIVIYNPNSLPGELPFVRDEDLWDRLSPNQKAMVALHEAFYVLTSEGGADDSVGARYLTSLVFSDNLNEMFSTDKALFDLFYDLYLNRFEKNGYEWPVYSVQMDLDGRLRREGANRFLFHDSGRIFTVPTFSPQEISTEKYYWQRASRRPEFRVLPKLFFGNSDEATIVSVSFSFIQRVKICRRYDNVCIPGYNLEFKVDGARYQANLKIVGPKSVVTMDRFPVLTQIDQLLDAFFPSSLADREFVCSDLDGLNIFPATQVSIRHTQRRGENVTVECPVQ